MKTHCKYCGDFIAEVPFYERYSESLSCISDSICCLSPDCKKKADQEIEKICPNLDAEMASREASKKAFQDLLERIRGWGV